MKIGHLHSWRQKDLWNNFNAILIRHQYETWDYARKTLGKIYWGLKYGKGSNREKLRDLIYSINNFTFLFHAQHYDLIFLSLNFDIYPSSQDFITFVKDVVMTYKLHYPNKEIIIGAGNECFEKVQSAEKVFETCFDTKKGIEKSVKPNLPVCGWNQKVRTVAEVKAFQQLCKSDLMKSTCKYMGIQSLGTSKSRLVWAINMARSEEFEVVDVELGHQSDDIGNVLDLFHIDKNNGIKKIFILCPYISKELANHDENFKNYALSIGDYKKEKFLLIGIIQHFKDKKKEEMIPKMLNEAIMGTVYKYGTRGYIPKLIQKCLNEFIKHGGTHEVPLLVEDGLYGSKTKEIVILYQEASGNLEVDGIVGRNTMRSLINYFLFLGK